MRVLDRFMNRQRGEWFNPAYQGQGNSTPVGVEAEQSITTPVGAQLGSSPEIAPLGVARDGDVSIQPLATPVSEQASAAGIEQSASAPPHHKVAQRFSDDLYERMKNSPVTMKDEYGSPQSAQQQNVASDPPSQSQISQGDGVESAFVGGDSGFSAEDVAFLKGLGLSAEDMQSFAGGYTPQGGGFFQQLYEKTMPKPEPVDEKQLKKMRNRAALVDGLGLLAQLGAALGGGDVKERRFEDTASGRGSTAERDLRNLYRKLHQDYSQGLFGAAGKDAEVGYRNWEANRKAVLSALRDRYNNEERTKLEGVRHENNTERDNNRHANDMVRVERSGEIKSEQDRYNWGERHKNTEAQESGRNKRSAASIAEQRANRASRERQNATTNSYRERSLSLRGGGGSGGSGGRATGGRVVTGAPTKGMKTVAYSVPKGTPDAQFNGVGYTKTYEYSPEEYRSLVETMKAEVRGLAEAGDAATLERLGMNDAGKAMNGGFKDDVYMRALAVLHPELIGVSSGGMQWQPVTEHVYGGAVEGASGAGSQGSQSAPSAEVKAPRATTPSFPTTQPPVDNISAEEFGYLQQAARETFDHYKKMSDGDVATEAKRDRRFLASDPKLVNLDKNGVIGGYPLSDAEYARMYREWVSDPLNIVDNAVLEGVSPAGKEESQGMSKWAHRKR